MSGVSIAFYLVILIGIISVIVLIALTKPGRKKKKLERSLGILTEDICFDWINAEPNTGLHRREAAVLIERVEANQMAAQAGLIGGDIIIAVNKLKINNICELWERIPYFSPVNVTTIEILRRKNQSDYEWHEVEMLLAFK